MSVSMMMKKTQPWMLPVQLLVSTVDVLTGCCFEGSQPVKLAGTGLWPAVGSNNDALCSHSPWETGWSQESLSPRLLPCDVHKKEVTTS